MRHLKHGVSLVAVLIALVVASFGAELGSLRETNGVTVESTYTITKDGDYLIGTFGLHW